LKAFPDLTELLLGQSRVWLVTGTAGFIGSNLLEALLRLDQRVIGLDNYATGFHVNLEEVKELVGSKKWKNFAQIEGDIRDLETCKRVCQAVDFVLHQAALGSVPRSIAEPGDSHATNVTGFLNMLVAARDNGVKRFVYASSSSVYGDHPGLPKVEHELGKCLSPYAATKRANELYAAVFAQCYGLETIGLRYFNVFGPRQDPDGPYAAVIPKWMAAMIKNEPVQIHGDGETTRDFCYIANVVQANLLAATVQKKDAINETYNIALHDRTSLNDLFGLLRDKLLPFYPDLERCRPVHLDFRPGDVRHSEADISKAERLLGYKPSHTVAEGLAEALNWYQRHLQDL
jgi:UDP-N-acetylglucosamine 4-epimerase